MIRHTSDLFQMHCSSLKIPHEFDMSRDDDCHGTNLQTERAWCVPARYHGDPPAYRRTRGPCRRDNDAALGCATAGTSQRHPTTAQRTCFFPHSSEPPQTEGLHTRREKEEDTWWKIHSKLTTKLYKDPIRNIFLMFESPADFNFSSRNSKMILRLYSTFHLQSKSVQFWQEEKWYFWS